MVSREYAVKTVKDFVEACGESGIRFDKVLVFGSVAAGTAQEYSNIDVALVSTQLSGFPFADWHLLSPIAIRFPDIEPHPFSASQFMESDPFIEEIVRTAFEIR